MTFQHRVATDHLASAVAQHFAQFHQSARWNGGAHEQYWQARERFQKPQQAPEHAGVVTVDFVKYKGPGQDRRKRIERSPLTLHKAENSIHSANYGLLAPGSQRF